MRDSNVQLTYLALERRAAACAEQLSALGIRAGDVIAIMLPNSVPLLVAMLAAWRIGAAVTPINPTFTARELAYQLSDSGAALLIAADAPAHDLPQLRPSEFVTTPAAEITTPDIRPDAIALLVYM